MSKTKPKPTPQPRAIKRRGYVHHIATQKKRKGFIVRYESAESIAAREERRAA